MLYSKTTGGFYSQAINGTNIPKDAVEITDSQYSALMQAQSQGSTIGADNNGNPIAIAPLAPTSAQIINGLISQVQTYIDSVAIKAGYDSANSCISYMNSTNPTWKAAAIAMNKWRDDVWGFAFTEKSLILAGTLPAPTQAQLVAALPAAPW